MAFLKPQLLTLPSAAAVWFTLISQHATAASSWVDPQTPAAARTTTGMKDDRELTLVFSDEFNDPGRSFGDGSDARWTAEDRPAVVNAALQYYNSSYVGTTDDGKMAIQTARQDANWVEFDYAGREYQFQRDYQSAMVSTWNKFCFTSGVIEISVQLPGKPDRGGLWPAFWMLGNLARPNYINSTDGVWPWSYDECGTSDEAVDADQVQKISNCKAGKGRGSPEIDIIEAQPGDQVLDYASVPQVDGTSKSMSVGRPMISSSLQVAPGVASNRRSIVPNFPQEGEWYPSLFPMGGSAYGEAEVTGTPHMLNNYWYGQPISNDPPVWQDGLSMNWQHSTDYYSQQTVIRTEWQTGKDDGYVRWFNGEGQLMYEITSDTLKSKPGAADAIAQIPYEAMYLILNTDISPRWGWNGCDPNSQCMLENPGLCSPSGELLCRDCSNPDCLKCPEQTAWLADFCNDVQPDNPAEYLIDYVRVYQDASDPTHTLGCDPPEYPTKNYIQENWQRFAFNSNTIKTEPLVVVRNGGGSCAVDTDCRGNDQNTGTCVGGECSCPSGWTGPQCLSPCIGEYAVECDAATQDSDAPSTVPSGFPSEPPLDAAVSDVPSGSPASTVSSEVPSQSPMDSSSEEPSGSPAEAVTSVAPSISPTEVPSLAPIDSTSAGSVAPTDLSPSESPSSMPESLASETPTTATTAPTATASDAPSSVPVAPSAPSTMPVPPAAPSFFPVDKPAECVLNEECAALGLDGMCCPTVDNWTLDCCRGPRPDSETCTGNPKCSALGLTGLCCPTVDDWLLDCCETVPNSCQEDGACEVRSAEVYLEYLSEGGTSEAAIAHHGVWSMPVLLVSVLLLLAD